MTLFRVKYQEIFSSLLIVVAVPYSLQEQQSSIPLSPSLISYIQPNRTRSDDTSTNSVFNINVNVTYCTQSQLTFTDELSTFNVTYWNCNWWIEKTAGLIPANWAWPFKYRATLHPCNFNLTTVLYLYLKRDRKRNRTEKVWRIV